MENDKSKKLLPGYQCLYIQSENFCYNMVYYPKIYKVPPILTIQTIDDTIAVITKKIFENDDRTIYNTTNLIPKKKNLISIYRLDEKNEIFFMAEQGYPTPDHLANGGYIYGLGFPFFDACAVGKRLYLYSGKPIQLYCRHDYDKYYLISLWKDVILVACFCGLVQVWNINKKKVLERFYNEKMIDYESKYRLLSVEKINDKTVAIANNNDKIKIWQITNSRNGDDNYYSCTCIYTMYGQSAMSLRYNKKTNILFAAGKDSTIKLYKLDYTLNGQWFLNIVVEDVSLFDSGNDKFLKEYEQIPINEPEPFVEETNFRTTKERTTDELHKSRIMKMYICKNGNIIGLKENGDVYNLLERKKLFKK